MASQSQLSQHEEDEEVPEVYRIAYSEIHDGPEEGYARCNHTDEEHGHGEKKKQLWDLDYVTLVEFRYSLSLQVPRSLAPHLTASS